jgi:hypothetical protein
VNTETPYSSTPWSRLDLALMMAWPSALRWLIQKVPPVPPLPRMAFSPNSSAS